MHFKVITETHPTAFEDALDEAAAQGWTLASWQVMPDPKHPSGRIESEDEVKVGNAARAKMFTKARVVDHDDGTNVALVYVAMLTRH